MQETTLKESFALPKGSNTPKMRSMFDKKMGGLEKALQLNDQKQALNPEALEGLPSFESLLQKEMLKDKLANENMLVSQKQLPSITKGKIKVKAGEEQKVPIPQISHDKIKTEKKGDLIAQLLQNKTDIKTDVGSKDQNLMVRNVAIKTDEQKEKGTIEKVDRESGLQETNILPQQLKIGEDNKQFVTKILANRNEGIKEQQLNLPKVIERDHNLMFAEDPYQEIKQRLQKLEGDGAKNYLQEVLSKQNMGTEKGNSTTMPDVTPKMIGQQQGKVLGMDNPLPRQNNADFLTLGNGIKSKGIDAYQRNLTKSENTLYSTKNAPLSLNSEKQETFSSLLPELNLNASSSTPSPSPASSSPVGLDTVGASKIIDLNNLGNNNNAIISKIENYIMQSAVANEKSIGVTFQHDTLGTIGLTVDKGKNNSDVQISILTNGKNSLEFFNTHQGHIVNSLKDSGISVSNFRIENSAANFQAAGNSFIASSSHEGMMSSFGHNLADGGRREFFPQSQSAQNSLNGQSSKNENGSEFYQNQQQRDQQDQERRKYIWEQMQNKEYA